MYLVIGWCLTCVLKQYNWVLIHISLLFLVLLALMAVSLKPNYPLRSYVFLLNVVSFDSNSHLFHRLHLFTEGLCRDAVAKIDGYSKPTAT